MVKLGGRSQLEICVDSVESAREAAAGGADRLELCGNLIIGGTSPDPNLLKAIRHETDIPVFCMVRPRFGDFLYTEDEYQICLDDVRMYRELGADGIVIGILKPDGTLDADRIRGLIEEAGGMGVTLHRCFDLVKDPAAALEKAVDLGIDIILTSGGKQTAPEGTGSRTDPHTGRLRRECREHSRTVPGDGNPVIPHVWKADSGERHAVPERGSIHGTSLAQ